MGNWIRRLKEERIGDWTSAVASPNSATGSPLTSYFFPAPGSILPEPQLASFLVPIPDKDRYGETTFAADLRFGYEDGPLPSSKKDRCRQYLDCLRAGATITDEAMSCYIQHQQTLADSQNLGYARMFNA